MPRCQFFCRQGPTDDSPSVPVTAGPEITLEEYTRLQSAEKENKKTIEGLKDMLRDLKGKQQLGDRQIKELTFKLSQEMSTKVASNESAIENVSIRNRPMIIADDYRALCSNEWLEAKTALDKHFPAVADQDKLTALCAVLREAEATCSKELENKMHIISSELQCSHHGTQAKPDQCLLPSEVNNAIGDHFRNQADSVDLEHLSKIIGESLCSKLRFENTDGKSPFVIPEVVQYIQAATRIVWKMVIQRPKMQFQFSDKKYDPTCHEIYWNSCEVVHAVGVVDVYPGLTQGPNMVVKGTVLLMGPDNLIHDQHQLITL